MNDQNFGFLSVHDRRRTVSGPSPSRLAPGHCKGAASSPSPSLLRKSTSPEGRGFGSTAKLLVLPRALPLGELSPQVTERARILSTIHQPLYRPPIFPMTPMNFGVLKPKSVEKYA